jgi:hypothetical protein
MSDLGAAVAAVEAEISDVLTTRLRTYLVEKGWPSEAADCMTVQADDGRIIVRHNNHPQVMEMEYGLGDQPGIPAVRTWVADLQQNYESEYWEKLSEAVWKWATG